MKPPNVIFMTPNGRFEVNKKICLSISGYHPETWRPSWSIRTALLAMIGFMPTHGNGAIGSLDYTDEERKALAKKSLEFVCPVCGLTRNLLLEDSGENEEKDEIAEFAAQLTVSKPKESKDNKESEKNEETSNIENLDPTDNGNAIDELTVEEPIAEVEKEETPEPEVEPETDLSVSSRPRNADDLASFILMWLLTFAILFLIYRRLRKHYDLDLVELFDVALSSLLPS